MKAKRLLLLTVMLLSVFSLILVGCGGGGGTTTTTTTETSALKVAEKVSVVDAQLSSLPASKGMLRKGLSTSDIPANSDYFNDEQVVFVEERSAEAFDIVNEILCSIAQSKYDDMLNKGAYKAQIDMNKCTSGNDSASSAGQSSQNQSSASTMPDYEMWTMESSRVDNNSPHIVKVWVHEEAGEYEPAKVIFVKATITEGKSSTNPYGIFTMNFKAHPVNNDGTPNTSTTMFKGLLKAEKDATTGKVLLKFANAGGFSSPGGDITFDEKVVLDRAVDGSTGSGTTYISDTHPGGSKTAQFNIAFNTSYFRRSNGTNDKCFSRTTFDETAWRYGLYDSNGTRVERNSGFSIKKDGAYGWIGYYGLWFPESVTVNNGDTVYKVTYGAGGETATPYTVIKKGGRLKKHTKHTTTLANIKGIPLDGWMEGDYPNQTNYRVKWDSTAQQFKKFAKLNQTTYMWENITEAAIDLSLLNFGELNFWSQAIGGQVRIKLTCSGWDNTNNKPICSAPGNTTEVIYFTEEVVFPGDSVPSTLRCYDNCPKYTAASSGINPSDPYNTPDYNPSDGTTYYTYTFAATASDMILKDNSGNSLIMSGAGSGFYQWGAMSGPLFEPTSANLALLACDWPDPITGQYTLTCGWKAWGALDEYYTWETGPDQWNQFTALQDSGGTPLRFQAPLQVAYTHSQTDTTKPDYKYNGTKFYLEYSGFGNLWGIPGKCIDFDTGADTSCGPNTRWIAEFTIPDGSEVTDASNNTTKYLVKALEKEQRMSNVAAANCSALTITSYTLPSMTEWTDPDIGTEPTVTNAPAVIGGVLQ
ncbi:MAG: hypothetical protein AB1478_00315 [Nitrospirota bacterium]